MAWRLVRLPSIRVPPAFGWWLLFLGCVIISGAALGVTAPGTLQGSFVERLPAFLFRFMNYVGATIAMLFALNLPEREMSTQRIVRLKGYFFIWVLIGGLMGTAFPNLSFSSPLELLLPQSIGGSRFLESLIHLSFAQVQDVLGYESPRPSAPFPWTNVWGNVISILMVWFIIAWGIYGSARSRLICGILLMVSAVPVIYSLNRGVWIGLVTAGMYVCIRLAMLGRVRLLLGVGVGLVVAALVLLVSPLATIATERVANPHSNDTRANTSLSAITAAASSPVLGYGSTRPIIGSAQSIAVGRSASCPQCGNAAIGGAGQLWLLLIAQGFLGTILYVGFFVRVILTYRHERGAVAIGGTAVLIMSLVFMPFYGSEGMPLALCLLAVAVMERERLAPASVTS
jgi:hypothetical protein